MSYSLDIKNYWGGIIGNKGEGILMNSRNKYSLPSSIYFIITIFAVRCAKEKTLLPTDQIKIMYMEVVGKIITGDKINILRCMNFWDINLSPTSSIEDSTGFITHIFLK